MYGSLLTAIKYPFVCFFNIRFRLPKKNVCAVKARGLTRIAEKHLTTT
jgi:hypothetical protein